MTVILSALGEFLLAAVQFVLEGLISWVGEIVLYLVTLGRHKPRWDLYMDEGGSDYAFLSEMSFWVGVVAICGMGGAIMWWLHPVVA